MGSFCGFQFWRFHDFVAINIGDFGSFALASFRSFRGNIAVSRTSA